jgi:hypothetical protein
MACARCDFYTPKEPAKVHLLEAESNLQNMTAAIPLSDDEQAAVDDGQAAVDRLLGKLADTPTPAGPTPRQLAVPGTSVLLPVVGGCRVGVLDSPAVRALDEPAAHKEAPRAALRQIMGHGAVPPCVADVPKAAMASAESSLSLSPAAMT